MRLANLFCDHMVLQAEKPVRFFGFGKGKIEVCINSKKYVGNSIHQTKERCRRKLKMLSQNGRRGVP